MKYTIYRAYCQASAMYTAGLIDVNDYCVEYERLRHAQFD